jgi:hypothetical protein
LTTAPMELAATLTLSPPNSPRKYL